jgi:hypothetical protein
MDRNIFVKRKNKVLTLEIDRRKVTDMDVTPTTNQREVNETRCFACDRKLGKHPRLVDTRDGQTVHVGSECFRLIKASGKTGYQPPTGGPRLYLITDLAFPKGRK